MGSPVTGSVPVMLNDRSTTCSPVVVKLLAAFRPLGPKTDTSPTPSQLKTPKSTSPFPLGTLAELGAAATASKAAMDSAKAASLLRIGILLSCGQRSAAWFRDPWNVGQEIHRDRGHLSPPGVGSLTAVFDRARIQTAGQRAAQKRRCAIAVRFGDGAPRRGRCGGRPSQARPVKCSLRSGARARGLFSPAWTFRTCIRNDLNPPERRRNADDRARAPGDRRRARLLGLRGARRARRPPPGGVSEANRPNGARGRARGPDPAPARQRETRLQSLVALHHVLTVEDAEVFVCASSRDQVRCSSDGGRVMSAIARVGTRITMRETRMGATGL